jgi:hypothetical protein
MGKRKDRRRMEQMVRENEDPVGTGPCSKGPDGWWCSRSATHPGSCALHEVRPKEGTGRYYGGWGTIHGTDSLDIVVNEFGSVVAVWFRCQQLPFRQSSSQKDAIYVMPNIGIIGIEIEDK